MFKFIFKWVQRFFISLQENNSNHTYIKLELEKNSNLESRQELDSLLRQK